MLMNLMVVSGSSKGLGARKGLPSSLDRYHHDRKERKALAEIQRIPSKPVQAKSDRQATDKEMDNELFNGGTLHVLKVNESDLVSHHPASKARRLLKKKGQWRNASRNTKMHRKPKMADPQSSPKHITKNQRKAKRAGHRHLSTALKPERQVSTETSDSPSFFKQVINGVNFLPKAIGVDYTDDVDDNVSAAGMATLGYGLYNKYARGQSFDTFRRKLSSNLENRVLYIDSMDNQINLMHEVTMGLSLCRNRVRRIQSLFAESVMKNIHPGFAAF